MVATAGIADVDVSEEPEANVALLLKFQILHIYKNCYAMKKK
jgi:hypothetical protein